MIIWHEKGEWNDVPCNYYLPFVCKKSRVACGDPPPHPRPHRDGTRQDLLAEEGPYKISSLVRYHNTEGFVQRHVPTIQCQPSESWEETQITCTDPSTYKRRLQKQSPWAPRRSRPSTAH